MLFIQVNLIFYWYLLSFLCIYLVSSKGDISTSAPDIMLSEVFLIFFVLAIWLSAIGFCLNQYKSLRRLETQVHYCVNRKDPLNIGEIKIVEREQDSIIYKKKRYSTALDTHISPQELNAMHYVEQYLPKNTIKKCPSAISALVLNRDDLLNTTPLSTATRFDSSNNIALTTYHETSEYQKSRAYSKTDMESNRYNLNISHIQRTGKNISNIKQTNFTMLLSTRTYHDNYYEQKFFYSICFLSIKNVI